MCALLGVSLGWWSVAGIVIEIAGFILLFREAYREIVMQKFAAAFGLPREIELKLPKDAFEVKRRIYHRTIWPIRVRWYTGAMLAIGGLALQLVGSWPCST